MTLTEFIARQGITIKSRRISADDHPHLSDDWPDDARHFRVKLKNKALGTSMTTYFSQGAAWDTPPTTENVLGCLLDDVRTAVEPFSDWADNFGYDTDSRRAHKTWKAVRRQTRKLTAFLGNQYTLQRSRST